MSGSSAFGIVESAGRRLTGWGAADASSDGMLLERFFQERDEEAFEKLVLRHGPRVRRICLARLGDGQDADDAVQATFIALVNSACEFRRSEAIGGWLSVVARRIAGRAKMRAARRRFQERADVDVREIPGRVSAESGDADPILRAEVDRLPEKYRLPIELCYWEGLSSEQAAERLRCPTGTLKWRLSRAREILRGRLGRAGVIAAALIMWRRPSTATAGITRSEVVGESILRHGRRIQRPEIGLSNRFVRETVALGVYVRDHPFSFLIDDNLPLPGRGGCGEWSTRRWIIIFLAIIAAMFSTPIVRWVTERDSESRFSAPGLPNRAIQMRPPQPSKQAEEAPPRTCPSE